MDHTTYEMVHGPNTPRNEGVPPFFYAANGLVCTLVGFLKDPRVILSRIRFLFGRQIGKVEVFTNLSNNNNNNNKEAAGVSPGSFVREAWAMFLLLYLPPRPNGPKAQR
jgi:hypothetical protein